MSLKYPHLSLAIFCKLAYTSVTFNIHYNKVEPPRYVGIPHNLVIEVEQVEM